ncbi:MAG: hypothetical protein B7Y48_00175 [Methylophilales bacterium 28-44-11]|nr:MAG: hypothetical protein B7Y48_00175 [Methylophilales bacterium 28-44-11]
MTREDVMRELELLPVWTLNSTWATQQTSPTEMQIVAPSEVLNNQAEVVENQVEVIDKQDVIARPIEVEPTPPSIQGVVVEVKQKVAWMLYCPLDEATDQDALTLLNNMVRAMQLLSTDYLLVHQSETLARYQSANTLLFGLEAAQALLGKAVTFEGTTEQPYLHDESCCWVVPHPKQLMENPSLKREAWQIMCAAKAHVQKAASERLQQT